jgi:hypothetical protein
LEVVEPLVHLYKRSLALGHGLFHHRQLVLDLPQGLITTIIIREVACAAVLLQGHQC